MEEPPKGTQPCTAETAGEMPSESAAPLPVVMWVHDGPVCVTVVDLPPPYAPRGVCRCPACCAHDPDEAVRFL
jgi:hypothetical protein